MVKDCFRCTLSKTRTTIVNGSGPGNARIVLIGEAPGEQEDLKGIPFVGRAGKFLDSRLSESGLDKSKLFITNVVRCRPPRNRKPRDKEIRQCLPNLVEELKQMNPSVVIALGTVAFRALTGQTARLVDVIGEEFEAKLDGLSFCVIPCYHPSAAMRNPKMKDIMGSILLKAKLRIESTGNC